MSDTPRLFRVIVQVDDMDAAVAFYTKLLGADARRVHASRSYLDCGPVILALVDPTADGQSEARPNPDYVYFATDDLEAVHARARDLGCLAQGQVHDDFAGAIARRPWGERSFYARDPIGNGLCFVDARTLFTGR